MKHLCDLCGELFSSEEETPETKFELYEIIKNDTIHPLTLCPQCIKNLDYFVNGIHEAGKGWNPNGVYCGECSKASCRQCPARARKYIV